MHRWLIAGVVVSAFAVSLVASASIGSAATSTSDQRAANRAVLALSDLPAGWRKDTNDTSAGDKVRAGIAACKTYDESLKLEKAKPRATSYFTKGSEHTGSVVKIFASGKAANGFLAKLESKTLGACLEETSKQLAEANLAGSSTTQLDSVHAGELSTDPRGDATFAFQVAIQLKVGSLSPTETIDLQAVRVGRTVALFQFANTGSSDTSLQQQVMDAVVARLPGTATSSGTAPTTTSTPANQLEQAKTSGGITITVHSAEVADQLAYVRAVNEHNVGDVVPAAAGGHYVIIHTDVTNGSSGSIDLTCGYPVSAKALDSAGRRYDPVKDLAWVLPSNPDCNASTNPGFTVPMTWAYLVPTTAKITGFEFQDETSFGSPRPTTRIALPPT